MDAITSDPFTGSPLLYKRLSPGYRLYSLGEDRADNGGIKGDPAKGDQYGPGADIPFTVRR